MKLRKRQAKPAKSLEITKIQLKKLLKKHNIVKCQVNLVSLSVTNNAQYRDALLLKYNIRECFVNVSVLLSDDDVAKMHLPKQFLKPKVSTVRSHVNWLPTLDSTEANSAQALSSLANYRIKNGLSFQKKETSKSKSALRKRAASLFVPTTKWPRNEPKEKTRTMDDTYAELVNKINSPNRGLMPGNARILSELPPTPIPQWKQIYLDFKAKLEAKKKANP